MTIPGEPTDDRPTPPFAAAPVEMTAGFLDFLRATIVWKVEGLDDDALRRSLVPSGVTLLGMVKHLAMVERFWFQIVFAGEDIRAFWTADDPDADWRVEPEDTTAGIIALYRDECARSRAIVASADWDDLSRRPDYPHTLGWILTHMVEETARHCGHADILRELTDGVTGE
ncbi:MAG: DinB family protein [Thermomicrobiales bacterium]